MTMAKYAQEKRKRASIHVDLPSDMFTSRRGDSAWFATGRSPGLRYKRSTNGTVWPYLLRSNRPFNSILTWHSQLQNSRQCFQKAVLQMHSRWESDQCSGFIAGVHRRMPSFQLQQQHLWNNPWKGRAEEPIQYKMPKVPNHELEELWGCFPNGPSRSGDKAFFSG